MFQGVVLQMKDSIDRTVGVIDADGIVVACSELTCIGEHWSGAVTAVNSADHAAAHFEDKTFRPLAGWAPSSITPPSFRARMRRRRPVFYGGGGLQRRQGLL